MQSGIAIDNELPRPIRFTIGVRPGVISKSYRNSPDASERVPMIFVGADPRVGPLIYKTAGFPLSRE